MERAKWLRQLKTAVINGDEKKLEELSKQPVPEFDDIQMAQEALSYIKQAQRFLSHKKHNVAKQLQALKQQKQYSHTANTSNTVSFEA
ncbi:MAG: hypothetical protein GXO40_00650 [Epsilonproteobacteria bacterium]|jgi:hypothetical protein|nr:hypothetical protein [Campylobacterota bacterium]